ncbi:MAG: Imm10 family immunity protein [Hyphomicrobiaceae bacterium]
MRLRAERVWVMQDHNFTNVTFADNTEDPAAYIVVSRLLAPDTLQRRLGMDGVYLELDDEECAAYRVATGYVLDGSTLRIMVSPSAMKRLGLDGDLLIELSEPGIDTDKLQSALRSIFEVEPET